MRDKLDGAFAPFALAADKESFRSLLTQAEDWLYSEEVKASCDAL
jgi:hypothetical protein